MRKEWLSYGIPAVLLGILVFVSLRPKGDIALPAQTAPESGKLVIVPTETSKKTTKNDDAAHAKRVMAMRARYQASVDYGADHVVPARGPDNSFLFGVDYVPTNLGCRAGDLDVIKKGLPGNGELLFTVDSDEERKPLFTKSMTLDALRRPFSVKLKIPPAQRTKVYRFTLCTDVGNNGDCKSAIAAPMDKIQRDGSSQELKGSVIFYAQTFLVEAGGIKFLNNLRQDLANKNVDPGKAFGKHLSQSPYLNQLASINAQVKPIPTTFAANTLKMSMSYRDVEACKALGGVK